MNLQILFLEEKLERLNLETQKTINEIETLKKQEFESMFVDKPLTLAPVRSKYKTGKFSELEKGRFLTLLKEGYKLSDIASELGRSVKDITEAEKLIIEEREKFKRCKKEVAD